MLLVDHLKLTTWFEIRHVVTVLKLGEEDRRWTVHSESVPAVVLRDTDRHSSWETLGWWSERSLVTVSETGGGPSGTPGRDRESPPVLT